MKKVISSVLSVLMLSSAISATALSYGNAADETGKVSAELSAFIESSGTDIYPVWVWLSDEDKPDFDALVQEAISPKTEEEAEKYYSLSEEERTDLEVSTRLSLVKEYYNTKNQKFLADMGISSECVKFTSEMTPSMALTLKSEQITALEKSELVESIGLYDENAVTEPATTGNLTKEQFLDIVVSDKADFSDGGFIYRGGLKYDAIPNGDGFDLVVYGIKEEDYRKNVGVSDGVLKMNTTDYTASSSPAFFSGCVYLVTPAESSDIGLDNGFSVVFYVDNVLPGFPEPAANIIDASLYKTQEIASYIYPKITKGDIDNNGKVDASDASLILVAYSYLSTGKNPALNFELFDWNDDGRIDSSDASDVLVKYAELSTSIN